jgi:hypothetical protein
VGDDGCWAAGAPVETESTVLGPELSQLSALRVLGCQDEHTLAVDLDRTRGRTHRRTADDRTIALVDRR